MKWIGLTNLLHGPNCRNLINKTVILWSDFMDRQTKNELDFIIQIIILVLVTAFALTGPIISFVHQYHLIVEEFGKFIGGVFIYDNYAWWNLTALIWIPYGIYLVAWHKKVNKEMAKDMYKLMYWEKENKNDKN